MASPVDICNLALARLGDEARVVSINPPDQSAQANYCSIFYDMTLKSVLSDYPWAFASQVIALASVTNNDARWLYAYGLPADCLTINNAFPTDSVSYDSVTNNVAYVLKRGQSGRLELFTNQLNISIDYTQSITDTTLFDALFIDALAFRLAANLAGVIIKGDTGAAAAMKLMQFYKVLLKGAMENDANSQNANSVYTPSGIAARA